MKNVRSIILFSWFICAVTTSSAFAKPVSIKHVSEPTRLLTSLQEKSKALAEQTVLEAQKASTRWDHAKELLGKHYKKSVVREGEGLTSIDDLLHQWIQRGLKSPWKKMARKIAKTIIQESEKYSFDPIFLVAIIENESSFNPEVIGPCGEIGLMQLTPQTAKWIAQKYNLPWKGNNNLKNPIANIQLGSAYLAYLREKFDSQSQLYISAYNMGSSNVQRALNKQIWPKDYAGRVMQRYVRYYSELKEEIEKTVN